MINNKRGMTAEQIGILVLVVLVVVIVAFASSGALRKGFSNLIGFGGGDSNVGTIATQCAVSCNAKDSYEFCTNPKDVTLGDKTTIKETCYNLATKDEQKAKTGAAIKPCALIECPIVTPTA